jgi:hypothetical protein
VIPVLQVPLPLPRRVRAVVLDVVHVVCDEVAGWWADAATLVARAADDARRG